MLPHPTPPGLQLFLEAYKVYCMQVSGSQEEVERRQADTLAADVLENRYAANLDFGGIQTDQVFTFMLALNFHHLNSKETIT